MLIPGEHHYSEDLPKEDLLSDFQKHGFVLLRNFYSQPEIDKVRQVFEKTDILEKYGFGIPDNSGKMPKIVLWNSAGHDVTGMISRFVEDRKHCMIMI